MANRRPTRYKRSLAAKDLVDRLDGAWRSMAPWLGRAALLAVGLVLVATAAYVVVHVDPGQLPTEADQPRSVTEHATTWTPDRGRQETLRQRTTVADASDDGLVHRESIDAPASPRGHRFQLPLDDRLEVDHEPGARVTFPPTPLFDAPPETVHLAVPWADEGPDPVGALDTFRRMDTVEQDGVTLVRYHARHSAQFFVHEETVWFRQTNRTALVEPVTGAVVDYRDHETLWTKPMRSNPLIGNLLNDLTTREKVWEATVEPTEAAQAQLFEQAMTARSEHLRSLATTALAALAAGEMLLWAALAGRPRRFFDGAG